MEKPIVYSKFHAYNTNLIQMLSLQQFYCANYTQLNDPYDCRIQFSDSYIKWLFEREEKSLFNIDEIWNEFFSIINGRKVRGKYKIIELIENSDEAKLQVIDNIHYHTDFVNVLLKHLQYNIVCFTANEDGSDDDLLMWAHYTYSSNGVKLKFNFSEEPSKLNILDKIHKVNYDGIIEVNTKDDVNFSLISKGKGWQYENEYRIVTKRDNRIHFETTALVEMIFGYNMTQEDRDAMIRLTARLGYMRCKFSRMVFVKGKLTKVPIDYDPTHNEYKIGDVMEN
jgi:hypothetical protein